MIARKLVATLGKTTKPSPATVPSEITEVALGDCATRVAKVGWLEPAANRIPPNQEIESPFIDSGKIYATGLFAHSPSQYIFDLGGKWKTLRGEAGLHTAFQARAFGVVFVIKVDAKEVFRSSAIRGRELVRYDINLTGAKTLELLVNKANDGNGANWGLWLDPVLMR